MNDRFRMLPSYHYENNADGVLAKSVGKSLRDYKIEGQCVQDGTPTPEAPIEIECCGEKTKNLFNAEAAKDDGNWGGTAAYKQFSLFVFKKGVRYKISMRDNLCWKGEYPYNTSTQVALCVNTTSAWGGVYIGNSSVNYKYAITKDVYNETEDMYLYLYHTNSLSKEDIFETLFPNLQIEEGTEATEYEPYGYRIPVSVGSKNLTNPQKWTSVTHNNGINDRDENFITSIGDNYVEATLPVWCGIASEMFDVSSVSIIGFKLNQNQVVDDYSIYNVGIQGYDENNNKIMTKLLGSSMMADTEYVFDKLSYFNNASIKKIKLYVVSRGEIIENLRIYDFYITNSDNALYEPYYKKVYNIYLDEPLRKVGDYADYVDFKNGKVVRNVGSYIITGDEADTGASFIDTCFGMSFRVANSARRDNEVRIGLCNRLEQSSTCSASSSPAFAFLNAASHPYVYIIFPKSYYPEYEIYNGDTAKEILKQWCESENPAKIYFVYQIPIEESIDLPEILTKKQTNVISVETTTPPSNTQYQYYKGGN